MMMTAAGTVPAAKVFIMGVGCCGPPGDRHGAPPRRDRLGNRRAQGDGEKQVKSLGAKFVFADVADAATSGGYAKELSAEDKAKQAASSPSTSRARTSSSPPHSSGPPGAGAGHEGMVESYEARLGHRRPRGRARRQLPAVEARRGRGPQCVSILGTLNLAGRLAGNASPLFAKNLANFLELMVQKDGTLKVDYEDEIIKGTMIARDGALVNPIFKAS